MDIGQDVTEFVGYGSRLFRRLRREGGALSAVDLHILIVQLNILELDGQSTDPQKDAGLGGGRRTAITQQPSDLPTHLFGPSTH